MVWKKCTKCFQGENRGESEAVHPNPYSAEASVARPAQDAAQSTGRSQQRPAHSTGTDPNSASLEVARLAQYAAQPYRGPQHELLPAHLSQNIEPSQSTRNSAAEFAQNPPVTNAAAAQDSYSKKLLSLKDNPYGLKVLYEPRNASETLVDIVFIHGLKGSNYGTWLQKDKNVYWPIDLLSRDVPKARILTFGYDADVIKILGLVSQNQLPHHAETLLSDLAALRDETSSEDRKIVFIAHSLGGLVVKEALCISATRSSNQKHQEQVGRYAIAIAFLGTPHEGSELASLAQIVTKFLEAGRKSANSKILGDLKPGSDRLSGLNDSFDIWLDKKKESKDAFTLTSFYEEVGLPGVGQVVPFESAKLRAFPRIGIPANHTDMAKFATKEDTGYKRILGEIRRWMKPLKPQEAKPREKTNEEKSCLKSLFFREMNDRRFDVEDAADGTCLWLPQHPIYLKWIKQPHGLLWVKGNPGTGKSTLLRHALEKSQSESPHQKDQIVVASFFFHGRGTPIQRSPLGLFRALLHQILQAYPTLRTTFTASFMSKCETQGDPGKEWEWHEKELQDLTQTYIMEAAKKCRLQIYIDALDECGEETARNLASLFQRLISKQTANSGSLSICFSCRHYPLVALEDGLEICVEEENLNDIKTYVHSKFRTEFRDGRGARELQEEILAKASGVFQWVVIVVDRSLKQRQRGINLLAIQADIQRLPTELSRLYQDLLGKTDGDDHPQTLQLMQWILCAFWPLSMTELRFAMAMGHGTPFTSLAECQNTAEYVETDEDMEKRVQELSRGLAEVRESSNGRVAQFIHQSVNDYLIRGGLKDLDGHLASNDIAVGRAHLRLSRSCIKYISMEEMDSVALRIEQLDMGDDTLYASPDRTIILEEFPLLDYALESWVPHAKVAEPKELCHKDIFRYLQWPSPYISPRVIWLEKLRPFHSVKKGDNIFHLAAREGLLSLLEVILKNGGETYINSRGFRGMTPLLHCALRGHTALVKLLLQQSNIDVNSQDNEGHTALIDAVVFKQTAIVAMLLKRSDIDINSQDNEGQTALIQAVFPEQTAIVAMLLKRSDIDVNSQDNEGRTALIEAVFSENTAIAEMLLKRSDIDVNSQDNKGRTALSFAARNGHRDVVKLLLRRSDIDINRKDRHGHTALALAVEGGHTAIAELITKHGGK